eukprot:6722708-Pyramimonas_sp.AAC.1
MPTEAAGFTWFGVRGAANIAIPRCGSRAGMPLGDFFIAGFAPAHAKVHQGLTAERLTSIRLSSTELINLLGGSLDAQ